MEHPAQTMIGDWLDFFPVRFLSLDHALDFVPYCPTTATAATKHQVTKQDDSDASMQTRAQKMKN